MSLKINILNKAKPSIAACNSLAFLVLLNFIQIIAGSGIFIFTFGPGIGIGCGIMREGILNVISVITNAKRLKWKSWILQKLINFSFILLVSESKAIVDVFNTLCRSFENVPFVLEQKVVYQGWMIAFEVLVLDIIRCLIIDLFIYFIRQCSEKSCTEKLQKYLEIIIETPVRRMLLKNDNIIKCVELNYFNENKVIGRNIIKRRRCKKYVTDSLALCLAMAAGKSFIDNSVTGVTWYVLFFLLIVYEIKKEIFGLIEDVKKNIQVLSQKCLTSNESKTELWTSIGHQMKIKHDFDNTVKKLIVLISYNISTILIRNLLLPIFKISVHNITNNLNHIHDNNLKIRIRNYKAKHRILLCQSYDFPKIGYYLKNNFDARSMHSARLKINDLSSGGQAGIQHLGAVSVIINRQIQVYDGNGNLDLVIGGNGFNAPVQVQYNVWEDDSHGHWNLLGAIEPIGSGSNNCLFDTIAHQTGMNAWELRNSSSHYMERNIEIMATQTADIEWLERNFKNSLLIGGARYNGQNAADASRIIDASQGVSGHAHHPKGHPRGHASHPGVSDPEGSVENYSQRSSSLGDAKSGFESRNAQNEAAHEVLSTRAVQNAMQRLNDGSSREALTIPAYELSGVENIRMAKWVRGERQTDWSSFRSVTIVLQHHQGQQNNPSADVHVHTFYPRDY